MALSVVQVAQLKASLVGLPSQKLIIALETILPDAVFEGKNTDELTTEVLEAVDSGQIRMDSILNLVEYLTFSDEVEGPKGLTKENLAALLGMKGMSPKSITKGNLIEILRHRVAKGQISAKDLKAKRETFLKNTLGNIKKPETVALIAGRLLGTQVDAYSSSDMIDLALSKVRSGELRIEEIEEITKEAQKETKAVTKRKTEGPTLMKIASDVEKISRSVKEIEKRTADLAKAKEEGFPLRRRFESHMSLSEFLRHVKTASSGIKADDEFFFEKLLMKLEKIQPRSVILEQAEVIHYLKSLGDLTAKMRFSRGPDEFMAVLSEETERMSFPAHPVIHLVRDMVCERIDITAEEFNDLILECRKLGRVNLIEGAPYSEDPSHWIEEEGRKFYYFEIEEGLRGRRNRDVPG